MARMAAWDRRPDAPPPAPDGSREFTSIGIPARHAARHADALAPDRTRSMLKCAFFKSQ